ncbi:helix-turn-helix transcriptional regulator [Cognatishimia sp. WU-CL00825]
MLADAFAILKRALKARGMTYAQLGDILGLSEVSVKRMFAQRDCKMSRLFELCDLLDLPPEEVLQRARRTEPTSQHLPVATEMALAADPSLFHFLILLREDFSARDIANVYQLGPLDIDHYGRQLEHLGLAELHTQGDVRLKLSQPIRFRQFGPLHQLVKAINQQFLRHAIDRSNDLDTSFHTMGRRVLPDTVTLILQDIKALNAKLANLARQDQMIASEQDLVSFKLTAAAGIVNYPQFLKIQQAAPSAMPLP